MTDTGVGPLTAETVAAYIAKYATKSADDLTTGDRHQPAPGPDPGHHPHPGRRRHRRSRTTVTNPDAVAPYGKLGQWVHMLGFRGHFGSKSRHFSTTLGALRAARRDWQVNGTAPRRTRCSRPSETTTPRSRTRCWWSGRGGSPAWAG